MSKKAAETVIKTKQAPSRRFSWGRVGILISTFAMLILLCGLGYGYFQLAKMNISLAGRLADLQQQVTQGSNERVALQQSITALQAAEEKSKTLSAKQEQMIAAWQAAQNGNLEKWHVAEARYFAQLANDHVQFGYDMPIALNLLQKAEQLLQNFQDTRLQAIRQSLQADVARLKAMPQIDVSVLYAELQTLDQQLNQLPLPLSPLRETKSEVAAQPAQADLSWWQAGLSRSWNALRKVVVVRYTGSDALPLVLPEEKTFLFQNLHAQMENAMWGLLHRNAAIYQASLARAATWIEQYFVQDAAATQAALQAIKTLQAKPVQPEATNLKGTLTLFNQYFTQAEPAQ